MKNGKNKNDQGTVTAAQKESWTKEKVAEVIERDLGAAIATLQTILSDELIRGLVVEQFHENLHKSFAIQEELAKQEKIQFDPQTEAAL